MVRVRRAVTKPRITCVACGDRAAGVELATLSTVVAAGGLALVALCFDCTRELINVCQRSGNASTNASVNAASTCVKTQRESHANATKNASVNECVSGSDLSLPLGQTSEADQNQTRVEPKYSAVFDDFWSRCKGKKGNKLPAFLNFKKVNPPVDLAVQRWALWMSTQQWQRGASKHMEGWLTVRGWEDEPDPSEFNAPQRQAVPFAVAAEDSRKERHIAAQIDRLRDEQRPRSKPVDPRQEHREQLAARAAAGGDQ